MNTVKKLSTFCTVSFFTALILILTSCSNSPAKPEWVEAGAERDTTRGMIRHFGMGTGVDKDVALFQARQNAIQATQQECAGISLKKTVPRKTWVEPQYDPKDDEKISYYQAHAVVEVSEDDCEKAQTPGKSMAAEMGENERVSGQQDMYERVIAKREGLADTYYLKERAIAAQYATREDVANIMDRERKERMEDQRELSNRVENMTGKMLTSPDIAKADSYEGDNSLDEIKGKCDGQLEEAMQYRNSIISKNGGDRAHPTSAPFYELTEKMSQRCHAIYEGKKKAIDWDFEHEFSVASAQSSKISKGLYDQAKRLGHQTVADDPRSFPGTNVRDDGIPKTSLDTPSAPSAPDLAAQKEVEDAGNKEMQAKAEKDFKDLERARNTGSPEIAEVAQNVVESPVATAGIPQAVKVPGQRSPGSVVSQKQ